MENWQKYQYIIDTDSLSSVNGGYSTVKKGIGTTACGQEVFLKIATKPHEIKWLMAS